MSSPLMSLLRELRPGSFEWRICDRCRGHGKIDNPAFSNGFTAGEWAEWDGDERQDYLDGAYDVACPDCESGKVRVPDVARLTFAERRSLVVARRDERARVAVNAEAEAERRCGA